MDIKLQYGILVTILYTVYMLCTWPNSPDGYVLSAMVGAILCLAGVTYGKNAARLEMESTEDQE